MRRLRFLSCLLLFAIPAIAANPPAADRASAALDRKWRQLETRAPSSGARDIYGFLLTAVAQNWRPDQWAAIIALGEELHDRDPASPTYGNYRWYWREPKPNDRNAVEFSMQSASLTWAAYHDRLPPEVRERLAAALALGAEGMLRHKVDVSYTNIFLMRLANCILVGEALDRPDLVARGRGWFDEWFTYTRAHGIHEFSSPTYYGTDLTDLGALANYARSAGVRGQAEAALRLIWTDIAANWFTPYEGIAGAHSRDYGFLIGHGYLDQQLLRAGWLSHATESESHEAIDNVTFWRPPEELRRLAATTPRTVVARWGPQPWERSTHFVGRSVSLGSSGAGYGAQDKVLALTLGGGPRMPIAAFSLDYRQDPYGQSKMGTADGHAKLTHLMPFIASVQHGNEALLVSCFDPAHARNPAGGKAPIEYRRVDATFVVPFTALAPATQKLPPGSSIDLPAHAVLGLRYGSGAAALAFVATATDANHPAQVRLVLDGAKLGAARLVAQLAAGRPQRPVFAAVWCRVSDDIKTDAEYAAFLADAGKAAFAARVSATDKLDVAVPGAAPLHIIVDPAHERRLVLDGGDLVPEHAVLAIDGRDVAGPLLIAPEAR